MGIGGHTGSQYATANDFALGTPSLGANDSKAYKVGFAVSHVPQNSRRAVAGRSGVDRQHRAERGVRETLCRQALRIKVRGKASVPPCFPLSAVLAGFGHSRSFGCAICLGNLWYLRRFIAPERGVGT